MWRSLPLRRSVEAAQTHAAIGATLLVNCAECSGRGGGGGEAQGEQHDEDVADLRLMNESGAVVDDGECDGCRGQRLSQATCSFHSMLKGLPQHPHRRVEQEHGRTGRPWPSVQSCSACLEAKHQWYAAPAMPKRKSSSYRSVPNHQPALTRVGMV